MIRAADGSILPQGAGVTLTNGSVVDLSSLPVGGATSKLTATLTATGAALADLGGATVSIGWDAHFAALCLGIVPKADCTAAVALRIPAHRSAGACRRHARDHRGHGRRERPAR